MFLNQNYSFMYVFTIISIADYSSLFFRCIKGSLICSFFEVWDLWLNIKTHINTYDYHSDCTNHINFEILICARCRITCRGRNKRCKVTYRKRGRRCKIICRRRGRKLIISLLSFFNIFMCVSLDFLPISCLLGSFVTFLGVLFIFI